MIVRGVMALLRTRIRPVAGLLALACGALIQHRAGVSFVSLIGIVFYLVGAVILAPWIGHILAGPIESLFMPPDRFARPVPIYSRPRARRKEGHFEEAMAELNRLTEEYPDEVDAYVEMIDIAISDLHDPARAQQIHAHGLARLRKPQDRAVLDRMYNALSTRPVSLKRADATTKCAKIRERTP